MKFQNPRNYLTIIRVCDDGNAGCDASNTRGVKLARGPRSGSPNLLVRWFVGSMASWIIQLQERNEATMEA